MTSLTSWGRYFHLDHKRVSQPSWLSDVSIASDSSNLCYGLGRSYGDSCLNEAGSLIRTTDLNRFISFDPSTGLLVCEAGVTLADIIQNFLPLGFFLSVSPGTKFVTVGGAIANDVHGKNHHACGTFGRFVERIAVLRSTGEVIECSPEQNAGLFTATIGGLGLTGVILWAAFRLTPFKSAYIDEEIFRLSCLDDYFKIENSSSESHEFSAAWVDCLSSGERLGRGLYIRGNRSMEPNLPTSISTAPKIKAPIEAPNWALNRMSVKAFNFCYYHHSPRKPTMHKTHFDPFFYPLDSVDEWNKIYGNRGFFQYQLAVPENATEAVREALKIIVKSGQASFLVVLKKFGNKVSPGLLSFPIPGYTLSLDFANRGEKTFQLFRQLDAIVQNAKGRLYPAKDSTMSGTHFRNSYPRLEEFGKHIDPKFSSSFWRRVNG